MRFADAWMLAVWETIAHGETVSPRGMPVRERLGVQVTFDGLDALLAHPARDLNYRFAVAEWLWIASGSGLVEPVARYNSVMRRFSDDGVTLSGAYGPRLKHQWQYVTEVLRADPDSRQAVASVWWPLWSPSASKDVPCTIAAQFLLRGGRLHSVWTMRSSDLWLGLPYDAFTFARLTSCAAGVLGVPTGRVTIAAGSSHLYERDLDAARECVMRCESADTAASPELPGFPPASLTDALLSGGLERVDWPEPWGLYARALAAPGKAEALKVLTGYY